MNLRPSNAKVTWEAKTPRLRHGAGTTAKRLMLLVGGGLERVTRASLDPATQSGKGPGYVSRDCGCPFSSPH